MRGAELPLDLADLSAEQARINLGEQIALLHAVVEVDVHVYDATVHWRAYSDFGERLKLAADHHRGACAMSRTSTAAVTERGGGLGLWFVLEGAKPVGGRRQRDHAGD